jgi:hypothetical protein
MRSGFVTMVTGAQVRVGFERPRKALWEAEGRSLSPCTIERARGRAREQARGRLGVARDGTRSQVLTR